MAPPPAPPAPSLYVPTEEWTWRLLERGFSLDEAAAIRGLDRTSVIRHVTLAARQGKPVDPASLLDPETLRRWAAWSGDAAPPPPSALDDLWVVFLACRKGRSDMK